MLRPCWPGSLPRLALVWILHTWLYTEPAHVLGVPGNETQQLDRAVVYSCQVLWVMLCGAEAGEGLGQIALAFTCGVCLECVNGDTLRWCMVCGVCTHVHLRMAPNGLAVLSHSLCGLA